MTYVVTFAPAAQRDIRKLDASMQRRIVRKLEELADDPRGHGTLKLQDEGDDLYRVRVGDFRIVYAIDDDVVTVTVVRVRDRKDVYR